MRRRIGFNFVMSDLGEWAPAANTRDFGRNKGSRRSCGDETFRQAFIVLREK
jgi:hypothetical protein